MFMTGTLAEFNTWHDTIAKPGEGITGKGKVGYVGKTPAPYNQLTTAYVAPIKHPILDQYAWEHGAYPRGTNKTIDEIKTLGWTNPEVQAKFDRIEYYKGKAVVK